jgi:hypothetical protein
MSWQTQFILLLDYYLANGDYDPLRATNTTGQCVRRTRAAYFLGLGRSGGSPMAGESPTKAIVLS